MIASNKLTQRVFGTAIACVVVTFFAISLRENWDNVSQINLKPTPLTILAYFVFVAAILASGWTWTAIFSTVTNIKVSLWSGLQVHLLAWLLKYVPGQVGALIAKVRWGTKQGAGKPTSSLSFAYELAFLTAASTVPTVPIVFSRFRPEHMGIYLALYVGCLMVAYLATRQKATETFGKLASRLTSTKVDSQQFLNGPSSLRLMAMSTLSRIANGGALVLLAESTTEIERGDYLYLGASYVLAGIIGIWAVFVPSGLGVREGAFVALSTSVLGLEVAIALSLLARLYTTLSDVSVAGIYFAIRSKQVTS